MRVIVAASFACIMAATAAAEAPADESLRSRAIAACVAVETGAPQSPVSPGINGPVPTCACSVDRYAERNGHVALAALAEGADENLLDEERQDCRRSSAAAPIGAPVPLVPVHPAQREVGSPPPARGWASDIARSLPQLLGAAFVFIFGLTALLRLRRQARGDLAAPPPSTRPGSSPSTPPDGRE